MSDKLILVTTFNTKLNTLLGTDFPAFNIYRSKGLLTHLINRKHFTAAKYIDLLPDIISFPNYAGYTDGCIELVKEYKDNIFISLITKIIIIMSQLCLMPSLERLMLMSDRED